MTEKNHTNPLDPDYHRLLFVAFLAGFVSLAYEIVATKVLYYFFNESTITASGVIAIFLFGMGVGGFIFSRLDRKIHNKKLFLLILQVFIALYAALVFPNYDLVPAVFNFLYPVLGKSAQMMLLNKLLISFFYLIVPTVLMGMVFPAIIVMSIHEIDMLPEKIGTIYGLDLFGAVLGALASGFFFIPFWGIKTLIFFSVLINLAIGLLVLYQKNRKFIFTIVCFLMAALMFYLIINPFSNGAVIYSSRDATEKFIPRDNLLAPGRQNADFFQKVKVKEKKFFSHSPFGELSVFDEVFNNEQHRYLYIETRIQCSTEGLKNKAVSEVNFANVSIEALDKSNLSVLNIGLGCGFTLSEIVKHPQVRSVDVVEINPVMPEATKYFNAFTDHVLDNPKVNLLINDGYKYLLSTDKKYDLIIMDIETPWVIYSSNLYSLEFYRLVRKALNPDGIFSQWSYRPIPDAQVINYNTLKTVFADVVPKISGVFNDLYYIAGGKNIALDERETIFLNQMISSQDTRLNTLNNPYFGTEMMLREMFHVN